MSRPGGFTVALGLWLGLLSGVLWAMAGPGLPAALSSGAAVGALLIAVIARAGGRRSGDAGIDPDASLGSIVVAFGAMTAVVGSAFGVWLVMIGVECAAFGAFLIFRETRASRGRSG